MTDDESQVGVRLLWVGLDDSPIGYVNQFLGQVQEDDVIVSLGGLSPPVIIGETFEDRRAQAEGIPYVTVRPVARVSMSRRTLVQFIEILNQTVTNYDRLHESGD